MDDFVTLQDRVSMHEDKPQRHGTQMVTVYKGDEVVYYIWPVEDPDNLDARRVEAGLLPIEVYIGLVSEHLGTQIIGNDAKSGAFPISRL